MFKKKEKMREIKTSVGVVDYVLLVNDIADGYFDLLTAEYQPHLGIANAMLIFYNTFYKEKKDSEIISIDTFEPIATSESFLQAFNQALICDSTYEYDFAHAFIDAMDIVETKKSSVGRLVTELKIGLSDLLTSFAPLLDSENVSGLFELSKKMADGEITAEKIIDSYKQSKQYKEMIPNIK